MTGPCKLCKSNFYYDVGSVFSGTEGSGRSVKPGNIVAVVRASQRAVISIYKCDTRLWRWCGHRWRRFGQSNCANNKSNYCHNTNSDADILGDFKGYGSYYVFCFFIFRGCVNH